MRFNSTLRIALALAAVCAPSLANAQMSGKAAIEALENRFLDAFNAKDVDAIMKAYVSDKSLFVFDVGVPRQHVGADDYRKDWKDFFATFKGPIKVTLGDLDVTAEGNLGYGRSIQHVTGTDTKGKPVDFTVRVTDAYRKIGDNWLIVQEHVSVPVNFDTGKPDLTSAP
ncbi:MAG TPA: nuclear transport factor 2 family protein [Rhizomicrobium sp.]|jgi:ketosteroid isomerase-like protein